MTVLFSNNAIANLSAGISAGATSFSVSTGTGSLFPTISSSLDFFYVRLGSDSANEVVKVTARSGDSFTCVATTGAWSIGTQAALTISKEALDYLPKMITANTTVTVKTSGGDFTSLTAALTALQNTIIDPTKFVDIEVDDGNWTHTSPINAGSYLSSPQIRIVGKNVYSKTISGTTSSSGSTGAWSVTVPCSDTSNTVVGDWILIATASGGTNPTYVCGFHEITGVSTNVSITFSSTHKAAAGPSGAISATARIIKTRLVFNDCSGIGSSVTGRYFRSVHNLGIVGNNSASSYLNGAFASTRGQFLSSGYLGIAKFDRGISVDSGGLAGCSSGLAISNCQEYGIMLFQGDAHINNSAITGCPIGIHIDLGSRLHAQPTIVSGHTNNGIQGYNLSNMYGLGSSLTGCGTGAYAEAGAHLFLISVTFANNTTNASPAVNTQGNEYGYINT